MKKHALKSWAVITAGCALFALAFDWFYVPNRLTCGGVTGLAQIVRVFVPALPVGLLALLLNLPLYALGLRRFGPAFLARSLYAALLSSLLVDAIASVHIFAPGDPLLACLYGGVLLGVSTGLLMREEATTGGTELAARLLWRRLPGLSIGSVLLLIDLAVILAYAAAFGALSNALYGGAALFVSAKTVDWIVCGGNTAKLAFIISEREEEISGRLLALGLGVTKVFSMGAYTRAARPMLLCAVRRREIVLLRRTVKKLDPAAFLILCDAGEVLGEGFGEYRADPVE